MEEALLSVAVILLIALLVVPFVALGLAMGARKRIRALELELDKRKVELRYLYDRIEAEAKKPPIREHDTAPAKPATEAHEPRATPHEPRSTIHEHEPEHATGSPRDDSPTSPATPAAPPSGSQPSAPRTPTPRPAPPPLPVPPPAPSIPLEQRLATIFTRAGAAALLLGVLYFYKYAVDNAWIGPAGRVALGALAGMGILAFAELMRAKTRAGYIHALVGVGLACLYISAYASSAFYQLVDVPTAFVANTVILLLGAALAWRHRAEAILVLVLIAGFANPILLSTGQDRPFALFTYLFILTSVALFVGTKHNFKISRWLAVAGVAVLFGGWYGKFFETFDNRGQTWVGDVPPETLVGAYHELSSRIVPIAFIAIFTAQWLGTAFAIRRVTADKPSLAIKPLAICALLLSHAGASAMLFDQPRVLGGTMIILAAVAVLSLRALDAMRFLLIPMLAAFALLAALAGESHDTEHLVLLALLGVWSGVYVAAFLKDLSDRNRELSRGDAIRASIAIFAFGTLASILLLPPERVYTLGLVICGISVTLAILASRAKSPGLMLASVLLTILPLIPSAGISGENSERHADYAIIGIAALWSLAYAAVLLRDAIRGHEQRFIALITLVVAMLGFLTLGLLATQEDVPTLRAILTGGTGATCLAFAIGLERTRKELKTWTSVLAALALALFAPAVAFGLSGATITVVWAVLACIAMLILAEARSGVWVGVVVLLVTITLFRVFAIDIEGVHKAMRTFEYTYGRDGILAVPAFFNARAYALAASGAAFLGGASMLARSHRKSSSKMLISLAPVLATIAYALLTALLVIEVRTYLQTLPPAPPVPLDAEEFALFWQSVEAARDAQHNLLAMTTTVILALVAMTLLGIGFALKDPFHRWLGLALFLGTLGKLVFWDVWNLARIYQVVSLTVVGALLLGSGFLYARLKALFKGETAAAAVLLIALLAGQTARADAPSKAPPVAIHRYTHAAAIEGVNGAGDYRTQLAPEIYRASASQNLLEDVRIADADAREVPFVIRPILPVRQTERVAGRMLDPGVVSGGGYRALFELTRDLEHCEVELELSRSSAFLRRTMIETGDKPKDLQIVSQGAVVYSIEGATVNAESTTVRYPRSIARWVRITLMPDRDAAITEILGATFACTPPEAIAPRERVPLAIVETKQNADAKTTEVTLDAGAEGAPIERIHLRLNTPELVRRVELRASSYKNAWPPVGSGVIYRVGREGPESTSIAIRETRKRWFQLVIHDENDAPIELASAEGSYPSRELIFRARGTGAHTLYLGDKQGSATYYDLAEILARTPDHLEAKPVTIQAPIANPQLGKEKVAAELPATEKFRGTIGVVLAVALLGLGIWAIKLLRAKS